MAYVPDPLDATQPTDAIIAETAQAEFRALKGSINQRLAALVVGQNAQVPVRQTILQGLLAATQPAHMAVGVGLNVDLKATTLAVLMSYAAGFSINGAQDFIENINADAASFWTGIPASLTSYLGTQRTAYQVNVPFQTLAPLQWSDTYDTSKQAVLQFAGAAGAVVFLDDFGNAWTPAAGAKVQINQFKFGTGALGGAGALNVLNGTTDYLTSTGFTSLGSGSWSLRTWAYITSLAAVNTIFDATNAAAFGAQVKVTAAGKVTYNLSSTGAANDIAAAPVAGAATIVVNGWHFYELTYDALAGVYRMYVDGVQDQSTASTNKICAITHINIGGLLSNLTGCVGYIDKPEFVPYCNHPAGTAYAVPVAAPSILTAGYASDWFDTAQALLKSPSAASLASATPPAFTSSSKLYHGECDASGAAISTVRVYAYKRRFRSVQVTPLVGLNTKMSANHNIGVTNPKIKNYILVCITPDQGATVGDEIQNPTTRDGAAVVYSMDPYADKLVMSTTTSTSNPNLIMNKSNGVGIAPTVTSWAYRFEADAGAL